MQAVDREYTIASRARAWYIRGMRIVCLDLEGVLIPEIWLGLSERTGVEDLSITTRDVPDYHALMRRRIEILHTNGLRIHDLLEVVARIEPLPGALEFLRRLRERVQVAILSDTFYRFAPPIMEQLGWPLLLCNDLVVDRDGWIVDFRMRRDGGKRHAVEAFRGMGLEVFAAGDSHNDLDMLRAADRGALFRAPQAIRRAEPDLTAYDDFEELLAAMSGDFRE